MHMRSNKHNRVHAANLHTKVILMIDQLSATADCHHQMILEASLGSVQWPTIVRVSDQ